MNTTLVTSVVRAAGKTPENVPVTNRGNDLDILPQGSSLSLPPVPPVLLSAASKSAAMTATTESVITSASDARTSERVVPAAVRSLGHRQAAEKRRQRLLQLYIQRPDPRGQREGHREKEDKHHHQEPSWMRESGGTDVVNKDDNDEDEEECNAEDYFNADVTESLLAHPVRGGEKRPKARAGPVAGPRIPSAGGVMSVLVGGDSEMEAEGGSGGGGGEGTLVGGSSLSSQAMGFLSVLVFWVSHTASVYSSKSLLARPGQTARTVVLITWCQVRLWAVDFVECVLDSFLTTWKPRPKRCNL